MSTLAIPRPAVDEAAPFYHDGLPLAAWSRQGEASGKTISARALVYIMVGHVTHHLGVLRDRYGLGAGSSAATAS